MCIYACIYFISYCNEMYTVKNKIAWISSVTISVTNAESFTSVYSIEWLVSEGQVHC